jgi:mRNA interferase ChpB
MTHLQIPDEQAAALKARAAEQGLTLEDWLKKLAGMDVAPPKLERKYRLADLIAQCDPNIPLTQEDREWLDSPAVGREAL